MKKVVILKLDLHDDKSKQKAMKTVSTLSGIDSIAMDMKEKKLTVIGTVDPVNVVSKLRRYWPTAGIISVGPAKEPEKKEEPKKEEPKKEGEAKKEEPKKEEGEAKKEEPKKEEAKKEEPKKEEKKEEEKKKEQPAPAPQPQPQPQPQPHPQLLPHPQYDPVYELVKAYRAYNPHLTTHYYAPSMEENPNACVIF